MTNDEHDQGGPTIDPAVLRAEQECLGRAMRGQADLEIVLGTLEAEDYLRPAHRIIHEALMERVVAGEPCDETSVVTHLGSRQVGMGPQDHRTLLGICGGPLYLHKLVWDSGAGGDATRHAYAVADAARRREVALRLGAANRLVANPGADDADLERELRAALERLRTRNGARWPAPRPLTREMPPLPVASLPTVMRRMVTATAASTQTPPDLAAFAALAVLSAATQGCWETHVRGGWSEQTVLYLAALADSGERKSAVVKAVGSALYALESQAKDTGQDEHAAAATHYEVLESRAKAARDRAAKAATDDEHKRALQEAKDLAIQLGNATKPERFRLTCGDVTPEALGGLMSAHGGAMAVLTAEGGTLAGRYAKDGGANIDLVLQAFNGERFQSDRVSRDYNDIPRPILTLGLIVQPDVIAQAVKVRAFTERGLLPRFLFALPESRVGTRGNDAPEMPPEVEAEWAAVVGKIFGAAREHTAHGEIGTIYLDHAAVEALDAWRGLGGHESRLHRDLGDLVDIRAWASKLPGLLVRIAALFALVERPGDARPVVTGVEMRAALDLAPYLVTHARAVLLGGETGRAEELEHVLATFRRFVRDHDPDDSDTSSGERSFSLREIHRGLDGREWAKRAADVEEALAHLIDLGYPRRLPTTPSRGGRPPSPRYQANPKFLAAAVRR